MRTRINCILRHNNGGEVPLSENLSIFFHPRQPFLKNTVLRRCLTNIKFR
jgi:hypothetical protein